MFVPVFLLLAVAFGISVILTPVVRRVGMRADLMDSEGNDGHVKQLRHVPNIGGVAIAWAVVLPMAAGLVAAWFGADLIASWFPAVTEHIDGMRAQTPLALAMLGGVLWLHALGLIDDRHALGPWFKLVLMVVPAAVVVLGFEDMRLLELLGAHLGGAGDVASIVLTLLWFLVVINAINFMDNMDGLAAGTAAVAGTFFAAAAWLNGQWFVTMSLALVVGASTGFLVYNKPKASIFMGDGGSLVLGFLLAFLTVRTTYTGIEPDAAEAAELLGAAGKSAWYALFMPLCVLAVPLYDLASVVVIRLSQGKSPMVGDQQHFSHRLRDRGLSDAQVMVVVCGCSAVTGIGGVLLGSVAPWQAALIGVQVIVVLMLLALYEHGSRKRSDA